MKFDPISEEEAKEAAKPGYLLKPGECDFEVKTAQRHVKEREDGTTSESIKLYLEVWDVDNKHAFVWDYLTPAIAHKLRHACYAVGLGHTYERGELEAEHFQGKGGRLIIRNKQDRGYDPKNDVVDYVVAERTKGSDNYQGSKNGGAGAVALKQAKDEAWAAFKRKNAGADAAMLPTMLREAIGRYFNGRAPETLGYAEWRRFTSDGFEPKESPLQEEEAFKDSDIPFDFAPSHA
jgi:hypothetical protein